MTCQVILEFKAKEDAVESIRSYLREILPDTRSYDGCVGLNITQNLDDPTSFAVVEQWDTRKHYENYLQWRTDTGVLDKLAEMIDGEPSIRFFSYFGV